MNIILLIATVKSTLQTNNCRKWKNWLEKVTIAQEDNFAYIDDNMADNIIATI